MSMNDYHGWLKALEQRRAPAMERAIKLVEEEKFDEAERAVLAVDDSIYGAVALGKMYTERLRQLVGLKSRRGRVEEVFRRALSWRQSAYPEPHTEIEADNYASGRDEDRAELVAILGYDPKR